MKQAIATQKQEMEHSIYLQNKAAEKRVYTTNLEAALGRALMWSVMNPYPMIKGEKK